MKCPRCQSGNVTKNGSIIAARGRVQRFECKECGKKFHTPLSEQPITERAGYWDIETSQAGRGAGNFGILYCWAIRDRDSKVVIGDFMHRLSQKEEKRVVTTMLKEMRNYDRLYTWYGVGHDAPISRSRAEYYGLDFPGYQDVLHTDLYFSFRPKFKLHSNKQDVVAEFFEQPPQQHTLRPTTWIKAHFPDTFKDAMKHIYEHCREDVAQTQWIHERIEKYMMGTRRTL